MSILPSTLKLLDRWAEGLYRSAGCDPARLDPLPRLRRVLGVMIALVELSICCLAFSAVLLVTSVALSWSPGILVGAALFLLGDMLLVVSLFTAMLGKLNARQVKGRPLTCGLGA